MKGSPLPAVTIQEIYFLLAVIVQMRHDQSDKLKDYWSTLQQFYMDFCRNTMKWDSFIHTLIFLNLSANKNKPDKTFENYNSLWKMRIFHKLLYSYAK